MLISLLTTATHNYQYMPESYNVRQNNLISFLCALVIRYISGLIHTTWTETGRNGTLAKAQK